MRVIATVGLIWGVMYMFAFHNERDHRKELEKEIVELKKQLDE